ncbi:hypothetical protein BRADI_2g03853v3 [Brachypodium distachyon]|uniref:Uncharacterized protein n=2 Tax=Brachypodium distachyon TaxID=15368 RepID=A0A0Q3IAG8_BRADI|nr:hypothetical protein BRADI_2g03853v3 [Brachypodium distachyon]
MASFSRSREPPVLLLLLYLFIYLTLGVQLSYRSTVTPQYSNHTTAGNGVPAIPCLPDQASALLRLKRSFTVTNESRCTLASWQAGTDCCHWKGVHCRGFDGRVTSLHLGRCHLESAALDPSVFRLTSLRHLNLAWNDFNGSQLPASGFERLSELTHLNLSSSSFDGQIPVAIGHLTNLVSLDLSTTFFVQEESDEYISYATWSDHSLWLVEPNIASLLANLSNLRELNLDMVDLFDNGAAWCAAFSNSTTPQLQVLSLRYCLLQGHVCRSLSSIPTLTVINLQYNKLHGPIPEFLADLPSLSILQLTRNHLEGQFPVRIFENRNLTALDISYNFEVSGSLPNFSSDSCLANLVVSNTNFSGPIPSSIGNLKSLNKLGLAATGSSVQEIPSSIGELTSLDWLEISGAAVVGKLPSWVTKLTSLVHLQFSNCGLFGEIPSSISNLKKLEWLALYKCNFSGPIPPQIFNLTQLETIYLNSNNFAGTVELSSFLELPNLYHLSLSYNRLSVIDGEHNSILIPNWLSSLRLASCNISKFPDSLRNLQTLYYLDLSDNQIHGAIPHWVWDNRSVLNLSHNQFNSIGYDYALPIGISLFDLSSNLLEGPMPIPGPYTSSYDCSDNQFSSIPTNFGSQLSGVIYLKASGNNLSGEIPPSICDARDLALLDLSYNNLSGPIPSCLMEDLNSLRVLKLKANKLQGELPHRIKQGCGFYGLDLSDNQIEGQLPRSLVACRSLQVFDIGNNHINDTFPCWMSTLTELQVLVLKSNKFFGKVGTSVLGTAEENCEFMKLRILSLASNNFSSTLTNKWLKSLKSMTAKSTDDTSLMPNQHGLYLADGREHEFTAEITYKGYVVILNKILKTLVVIDVSDNGFNGVIPESVAELVLLCELNMSHNALTGTIPTQLGALHQLESLDLSSNDLSGEIPQELAWLDFLSVLNLSYNQLVGRIPGSCHFQTYSNLSFMGNIGLCGSPLSKECEDTTPNMMPHPWKREPMDIILFLFIGLGFGVGFAAAIVMWWGIRIRKPSQG